MFVSYWGVISAKFRHGMAHATPESASPPPIKTGSPMTTAKAASKLQA